jgi:tetratricopeptide (TPR) repeat protein
MEPTNGHLWYEIGQLQLDSKNARGALLALGNVVILAEREPIERNELIGAYCQLVNLNLDVAKDIRMASHCAVQAAELGGDDAQVKEAVKRLLDVVQSDAVRRENPQVLPMVLYNLAVAIVRSQIPGDAVSFLDQAVSLAEKEQPAVARDARVRLAELKLGYGHYNAALADLDAAERIDAMDPNVFRVRGDVYEAMERRGEAREAYAHALGIRPSDSQSREALRRLVGLA